MPRRIDTARTLRGLNHAFGPASLMLACVVPVSPLLHPVSCPSPYLLSHTRALNVLSAYYSPAWPRCHCVRPYLVVVWHAAHACTTDNIAQRFVRTIAPMEWRAHRRICCAGILEHEPARVHGDQACQYEAMEAKVLSRELVLEVRKALVTGAGVGGLEGT
jgi:hypothetical protein